MTIVTKRRILLLVLACAVLTARNSGAINVIASPSPATVGQNATILVSATFNVAAGSPNCTLEVDFGDGSPVAGLATCVATPCSRSVNHAYTAAGAFAIIARSRSGSCLTAPVAPDPASTSITVQSPAAALTVAPVPSSFAVARGQSSSVGVNYQFTGPDGTLASSGGSFMIGGETLEVNPVPLSVAIRNGRGSAQEVITVPVRVLERTLRKGTNRFAYARYFSAGASNVAAAVSFTITTEAAADFEIKRIELYFENRRAETTVEKNYRGLRAYADIRFAGSGPLQGYWEVDGRPLAAVNRLLAFGGSVTLETPEIPPLPTFDAGSHTVRFVVTSPVTEIPLPSVLYFVLPKEIKEKPGSLRLLSPGNGARMEYSPAKFEWEKPGGTALFFVQFFERPDASPVFSAYTKDSTYALPQTVLKKIFAPGKKYYWKISAFDSENNVIAESEVRSFSFRGEGPDAGMEGEGKKRAQ